MTVHRDAAGPCMKAVEQLRREFDVKTEPDLIALFRLPGVVAAPGAVSELQSEEVQERLGSQIDARLEQALKRMDTTRRAEGQSLYTETHAILYTIASRTRVFGT